MWYWIKNLLYHWIPDHLIADETRMRCCIRLYSHVAVHMISSVYRDTEISILCLAATNFIELIVSGRCTYVPTVEFVWTLTRCDTQSSQLKRVWLFAGRGGGVSRGICSFKGLHVKLFRLLGTALGCTRDLGVDFPVETLECVEESCTTRLAGSLDQYRTLAYRTRALMGRDKKMYIIKRLEAVSNTASVSSFLSALTLSCSPLGSFSRCVWLIPPLPSVFWVQWRPQNLDLVLNWSWNGRVILLQRSKVKL